MLYKTILQQRESLMARNSDEHTPHPLDIALGSRVRLRRKELGFSQDQLARAVGITFQQVQKYEHGTNRISFSRLVEISEALECSVGDLIGNLDKSKSSGSFSKQVAYLTEPGASDLLEAYASIESPKRRRAILNLARQLANDQPEVAPRPAARRSSARA
jgi:transcriptional regulator with XRE-family HTH domain